MTKEKREKIIKICACILHCLKDNENIKTQDIIDFLGLSRSTYYHYTKDINCEELKKNLKKFL
ncbi:MAG: hypothetical protein ACOZBH_04605 [Patescibacteria group bacterium]